MVTRTRNQERAAPAAQAVERYNPQAIEAKWQGRWEQDKLYRATIDPSRQKLYFLTMLPYTSGDLHIGHWYTMVASDARARQLRMKGYNVMFPIGFDAFGLPGENAAIQRGIHPKEWTYANIDRMHRQLRSMGAMWDWEREAISSDPEFYRWTQWFFIQLFKHGLAYKKMAAVDFCPKDNTTLAREQVVGDERVCERCGTPVVRKELDQWFFKITDYADELLDFSKVDWPERVRTLQTNWIGRSEGAKVTFVTEQEDPIEVFTTRPDTLWGATFMVLAPEHPLVSKLTKAEHRAEVLDYVAQAARQTDIQREAVGREKTGGFTGSTATNPVSGERIPIYVADYVLMSYGSGAIMAVPAHDERDFAFAKKFDLPIPTVIAPPNWDGQPLEAAYSGPGLMVNSGPFDGTPVPEGIGEVIEWLEEKGLGKRAVGYRLRDWLISRQRYWGAPIPIVYCPEHGQVPVPDGQLPVLLPDDVEWKPTGESPLKLHPTWAHTTCPLCSRPATRDTDTMDTFMCSSWYQYRYLSPHYDRAAWDSKEYEYWMPVDIYTGGVEHATMHLIYTRFFTKALRDMGLVREDEPISLLRNQGQILGPDGQRMSKSRGNVIDPDEQVAAYGTDAVRAYLMFGYEWSEGGPWSAENIQGVVRWLNRVWSLAVDPALTPGPSPAPKAQERGEAEKGVRRKLHQTIRKVTEDLESFKFNTAVAALMELLNALSKAREMDSVSAPLWNEALAAYVRLMAPFTPHIAEELWERMGKPYSVHQQPWPEFDAEAAKEEEITLVFQVNGKVRDRAQVPADITEERAKELALSSATVRKFMEGMEPRKVLYVPRRLVNVVV